MKTRRRKIFSLALCLGALVVSPVFADLVAIVTPGFQFPLDGSVPPTFANLNLGFMPTIQIVGSIGGSNSLSPGSVTLVQLSASILDASTLDFNGAGGTMEVAVKGIKTNQLNTNNWAWPLSQPTLASPVKLNYDPILFRSNTNDLTGFNFNYNPNFFYTNAASVTWTNPADGTLRTNGVGLTLRFWTNTLALTQTNGVTTNVFVQPWFNVVTQTNVVGGVTNAGPTLVPASFSSGLFSCAILNTNGACLTVPISLGAVPSFVRFVLVCVTAASGYSVGDEIDVHDIRNSSTGGQEFGQTASATNLVLVLLSGGGPQIMDKSTGSPATISAVTTTFKFKAYVHP